MRQSQPSTFRRSCRGTKRRGFSLLELVMVVVIMGIVASIAVPRFAGFLANQHVEAAARRIVVDLALAQRFAKMTGTSRTVAVTPGTDSYMIAGIGDPDRAAVDYEVVLSQSPYGATLVSVDLGGDLDLVFDGFGMPDSGGSIVISVGSRTRTITVDADTGKASVP